MKKRIVLSFVLAGMLAFGVGMGTFAYFTSTATSTGNVFATGTIDFGDLFEGEVTAFIGAENWAPGGEVEESLTVNNTGTLPFKYRVTAELDSGDEDLYDLLGVRITRNGEEIYNGDFVGLTNLVLSDDDGLAPGESDTLLFTVTFPSSAGDEYQGKSICIKFTFEATQMSNPDW
jgi:spore coat-associated protein N